MTREAIKHQLEKLGLVYERFNISQSIFNIWAGTFRDSNEKTFERAIDEVIKHEEYPPTVATVLRYYEEVEKENREIKAKAKECYMRAITALGIPKNVEEFKAYLMMLNAVPREERIERAESFSTQIVNYANKATTLGKKPKSFIALIKECSG